MSILHPDDEKIIKLFPKLPRIIRTEEDFEKWEKHLAQQESEEQKQLPVRIKRALFSWAIFILAGIGLTLVNQVMPDGTWTPPAIVVLAIVFWVASMSGFIFSVWALMTWALGRYYK